MAKTWVIKTRKHRTAVLIFAVLACVSPASASLYGPAPYVQASDSPFYGLTLDYFYLEDFEDGSLNTPGVSVSGGWAIGPSFDTDSVDADDGAIDHFGREGSSWFGWEGLSGFMFTFDSSVLGSLPTHAGIVWTDGANPVVFKAFNSSGELGTIVASDIADGSYSGTTDEDNFFGVYDPGGIWKINISSGNAGIEVDHLQYGGVNPVPVPGAALLGAIGLSFAGWRLKRKTL